ncbi:transport system permease [Cupriavidus basilensis OR16]|uniref:Transport system permease n=1 Tax=Cupriavidus basilensis OR16 TaxID=1127483 RepID=H1S868_9BURK|nr:hypothetical protein [Cupriavidus basilensis]EHP41337.1 transport system permease [Cupriavidus basilensis OR16]
MSMQFRASRPSLRTRYRAVAARRQAALLLLACVLAALLGADIAAGPAPFAIRGILGGLLRPDSLLMELRVILWNVRLPAAGAPAHH